MREELYEWVRNLAVFYILFTAVLHLVPDKKYERYIRSFMGLLLIYMLCAPVLSVFSKSRDLLRDFQISYRAEQERMEEKTAENLQIFYLTREYETELSGKILETVEEAGIKAADAAVNIEGERITVILYVEKEMSEEEEGEMLDVLGRDFGVEEKDCQVVVKRNYKTAVDRPASSGTSAGSDRDSGF